MPDLTLTTDTETTTKRARRAKARPTREILGAIDEVNAMIIVILDRGADTGRFDNLDIPARRIADLVDELRRSLNGKEDPE